MKKVTQKVLLKPLLGLSILASVFTTSLAQAEDVSIKIGGMNCGGCIQHLEAKLCKLDGIDKCQISMGQAKLAFKKGVKVDKELITKAVDEAGHYKIEELTSTP